MAYEVYARLLNKADLDIPFKSSTSDYTSLTEVLTNKIAELLEPLLQAGADQTGEILSRTILDSLLHNDTKNIDTLSLLLKYGAADANGEFNKAAPLLQALRDCPLIAGSAKAKFIVEKFLYFGVSPYIKGQTNKTVIDYAKELFNCRNHLIEVLIRGQAPFNKDTAQKLAHYLYNYEQKP